MDRLNALDAIFLPMETGTQPLHVGSVLVLEGPAPEPAAFRAYAVERLAGVPAHRRRVRRMPLDLGRPVWVDGQVELTHHVRHTALETPGDVAQLQSVVAQIMEPRLDRARPLWELWQVDGLSGRRWAVVAKVHHTMVDGQAGSDLLRHLLTDGPERRPVLAEVVDPRPEPSPIDLVGQLGAWLLRLPWRTARLLVRVVRSPRDTRRRVLLIRTGLAQVIRPDLPPSIFTGPLGPHRTWGWTGTDLESAVQAARAAGCTLNDLFLAALAGGYRRYLHDRGDRLDTVVLRAIVPVSHRDRAAPERSGNLASAMFVDLPIHLEDPGARLSAVATSTRQQKSRHAADATAAVVRLADHVPAALVARAAHAYGRSGQGRVNVVASNVHGPPHVQYLAGRRVLELAPYVPVAQEIRVSAAMVSYAGRLTIGTTGDADALPDVAALVAAIGRELDELAHA